jgi:large subunit ribosomal protein L29
MKAKIWQETTNLSEVELQAKLRDAEDKMFRLKFKHASTPLKNPLEIRELRKNIARFKTLLQAKAQAAVKK